MCILMDSASDVSSDDGSDTKKGKFCLYSKKNILCLDLFYTSFALGKVQITVRKTLLEILTGKMFCFQSTKCSNVH